MKKSKVVLITGASSGMGKFTAKDLIKEGHTVYCAARDLENMQDLAAIGGHLIKMDVTQKTDCELGVKQIISEQNKIDVLWNNAGFGLYGPVEEIDLDKARYQFEVNLFGLANLTQLALPQMRKHKSGLIINTSSMGGKVYTPLGAWYHSTKHAVEGFSDCLRLEVKQFGIKVVVLEPGIIETGFGNILIKKMSKEHETGPYGKLVTAVASATIKLYAKGSSSSPEVISKTIKKIIDTKNPKTRYAVGKLAKQMICMRNILGDKIFDKIIMSQI